jgi:hypothetical protein
VLGATQPNCYTLRLRETQCNGLTFLEGHLQGYHLKPFGQLPAIVLDLPACGQCAVQLRTLRDGTSLSAVLHKETYGTTPPRDG